MRFGPNCPIQHSKSSKRERIGFGSHQFESPINSQDFDRNRDWAKDFPDEALSWLKNAPDGPQRDTIQKWSACNWHKPIQWNRWLWPNVAWAAAPMVSSRQTKGASRSLAKYFNMENQAGPSGRWWTLDYTTNRSAMEVGIAPRHYIGPRFRDRRCHPFCQLGWRRFHDAGISLEPER